MWVTQDPERSVAPSSTGKWVNTDGEGAEPQAVRALGTGELCTGQVGVWNSGVQAAQILRKLWTRP